MIAENYCYSRENLIISAMARNGVFGDLYFGEAEYVHEMKHYQFGPDGKPTWRHHWQVGKNGVTYPTHSLGPCCNGWMIASFPSAAPAAGDGPSPNTISKTRSFCRDEPARAASSACGSICSRTVHI